MKKGLFEKYSCPCGRQFSPLGENRALRSDAQGLRFSVTCGQCKKVVGNLFARKTPFMWMEFRPIATMILLHS